MYTAFFSAEGGGGGSVPSGKLAVYINGPGRFEGPSPDTEFWDLALRTSEQVRTYWRVWTILNEYLGCGYRSRFEARWMSGSQECERMVWLGNLLLGSIRQS